MNNKQDTTSRIFVQIASYRDTECQHTVKDLFEKAANPERVFVGICWQYDPEEDARCFEVEPPLPDNVRINPYHWKESKGVCWARHEAQKLYEGEDYVLMIDSHMRFVEGWDTLLIEELGKCGVKKPLISCHPASYTPPNTLEVNPKPTIMRTHMFDDKGDIRCKGEFLDRVPEKPLNGAFVAAGFIFTLGDIIREVPYDPYIYFNQEEILLAARFYTHGWDVFSATKQYLYHYYNSGKVTEKRPTHWADHTDWAALQATSRKRFNLLLGISTTDDAQALQDIALYSLGKTRSLADFEAYSGVDFKKRIATDRALRCLFIKDLMKYKDKPVFVPEIDNAKAPAAMDVTPPAPTTAPPAATAPLNMQQLASPASAVAIAAKPPGITGNIKSDVPEGVIIIENFIDEASCKVLRDYADTRAGMKLKVLDNENSSKDKIVTKESSGRVTDHVSIDGMPGEILSVFNHIYTRVLEPFYNVEFEWYERPQILRYSAGGKYNQHADSEHWIKEKNEWIRSQDRDYSVLLYLNEEYEGGELEFTNFKYKIKPKTGMLIGFPADHRYLHAALPTLSGMRYVIVSWAAILGSPRVREKPPYASVFLRNRATMKA